MTAAAVVVLTVVLMVATGLTRTLAAAVRRTAGRLLGEHVATPPPPRARLGDGPGWRAMAYLMLKLPAGLAEWYAVGVFWVAGVVNLSYPFWWLSFRNHSPGVRLSPVPVITRSPGPAWAATSRSRRSPARSPRSAPAPRCCSPPRG